MSVDKSDPEVPNIFDSRVEKRLSADLFGKIKPYCIELSQLSLLPSSIFRGDSPKLIAVLTNINRVIEEHYESNCKNGPYYLSANIADYIFFPISGLLKQASLGDPVIANILGIIGFLVEHCWSTNMDIKLIDQLFPLILYLIGGKIDKGSQVVNKNLEFKRLAEYCLSRLLEAIPNNYFQGDPKALPMLGNSITILLDVISSTIGPSSQEEIQLINGALLSLKRLYSSKVSAEQLSHILPGTVSQVINFSTMSKNLHFTIIVNIIQLLKELISKVFNDKDLNIEITPEYYKLESLQDLNDLWENQQRDQESEKSAKLSQLKVSIDIPATQNHRNKSWLLATSKQLKISLVILFKSLFSSSSRLKLQTKSQISSEIISFVDDLLSNCFISLFNDFNPLSIDVFSFLISLASYENDQQEIDKINQLTDIICLKSSNAENIDTKLDLLYKQIQTKLNDLISNKLSSIMFSTDDEKINLFIVSVKFQFNILYKLSERLNTQDSLLYDLKLKALKGLQKELVDSFLFNSQRKKINDKDILSVLSGNSLQISEGENKLDNIELPPHINANKLTNINSVKDNSINRTAYTSNLLILANEWKNNQELKKFHTISSNYFKNIYSPNIEDKLVALIQFLSTLEAPNERYSSLHVIESILNDSNDKIEDPSDYLNKGISLWISNNYLNSSYLKSQKKLKGGNVNNSFDINDYLVLDGEIKEEIVEEVDDYIEEISYLIMGKSQELIDRLSNLISRPELVSTNSMVETYKIYETSYSIAIDSIGTLSNHLSFFDFQTDFLIDYLYPLLEALTYQSNPLVQTHAMNSIQLIIDNYYNGSLETMIMDNKDYLIDCLSLKLSVTNNLTPSLPGILLIILKISGIKLLLTNQLTDILTEMFVLIDSYHGYSILVEGFFIVFEELIKQIKYEYLKDSMDKESADMSMNNSKYKPWDLSNREQLIKLIDDSDKIIDPYQGYDSSKEYFKRKPGALFDVQLEDSDGDSDDEDDEPEDSQQEEPWASSIPKNIYFIIQKIFNYGFRLLCHPSNTLKVQILKTLANIYPLLSTNYSLILPIISSNWPVLVSLMSGSLTLSTFHENQSIITTEVENLIIPSLQLAIEVLTEDRNEGFLGKKFIESWDFLIHHSRLFNNSKQSRKTSNEIQLVRIDRSLSRSFNPKMLEMYVRFIITGLNNYERTVSDIMTYEMVRFCYKLGIPKDLKLGKSVRNILWILKNE